MKDKFRLIVTIIVLSIFILMSVGYATYNIKTNILSNVYIGSNGEVAISNVVLSDYNNLQNPGSPVFTKDSISFDLNFKVESSSALEEDYFAEYDITINNSSFYDYSFASSMFNPSIETSTNENMSVTYELNGIEVGDVIPSKDSKTFKLKIIMYPKTTGDFNVSGDTDVNLEEETEEEKGSLLASMPKNTTIDLRGSTIRDKITVSIINTYSESKTFTFTMSNSNFKLVSSTGSGIGNYIVGANTTDTYDIYIERKSGVKFATSTQSVNIVFSNEYGNTSIGSVKILVDKDETISDSNPPTISDVNATYVYENGKVNLSWNATDVSSISNYIIDVYNSSDELLNTIETTNDDTSYTITGLSNGTYYFNVYGVDSKGNNGKSVSTSCTTDSGYCSRSTSASYKWVFDVTYDLGSGVTKSSGPDTVVVGESISARFTLGTFYSYDQISISMGGNTLSSSEYTWDNGSLTIDNVTGDVIITITASGCLIEGTKVLLANGKYKNIEDIDYTDLLSVWSYETGMITKEYPIWIEKTKRTNYYQKTTFSDGSVLNTFGYHGVFSKTHNEFISVDDYDKFKVGTKIYKVINGKLKEVTIKKIEFINEEVNYYHVVSSRYYNIIANDFLTTDGTVILSNLYGFNKNVTWNKNIRNYVINNNLYSYSEFKDIMPYYMFNGLRVEEGKYLNKYGLTKELFKEYLIKNQLNENMILSVPTNKNNKRLWMVTTDNDIVINKNEYLYEEGSYYKLPNVLGVKKWYSTSEDKYYLPGEEIKVNHSMHFMAIK